MAVRSAYHWDDIIKIFENGGGKIKHENKNNKEEPENYNTQKTLLQLYNSLILMLKKMNHILSMKKILEVWRKM